MNGIIRIGAALLALGVAAQAQAAPKQKTKSAQDSWFTMGGGYYNGQDYDRDPNNTSDDDHEANGLATMVAFNTTGESLLLRARVAWMFDYTSNTAEDVGLLLGLPLGRNRDAYIAVGATRLTDVSNRGQSPTVGVPVELLFYPTRGLEFSLFGNFNPDSDFIGVSIGGVFGKQRSAK